MELGVQLLALAVLSTAEFCAGPIEGGAEDPQFCRMATSQEVSTPYFSIVVEPGFLVGVNRQGRKLRVQSSLWQTMDVLTVERVEGSQLPDWPDCPEITETIQANVTWHECQFSIDGTYERRLAAVLNGGHVLIEYSYDRLGASSAPALERMTQSIRVHAN